MPVTTAMAGDAPGLAEGLMGSMGITGFMGTEEENWDASTRRRGMAMGAAGIDVE